MAHLRTRYRIVRLNFQSDLLTTALFKETKRDTFPSQDEMFRTYEQALEAAKNDPGTYGRWFSIEKIYTLDQYGEADSQ